MRFIQFYGRLFKKPVPHTTAIHRFAMRCSPLPPLTRFPLIYYHTLFPSSPLALRAHLLAFIKKKIEFSVQFRVPCGRGSCCSISWANHIKHTHTHTHSSTHTLAEHPYIIRCWSLTLAAFFEYL